MKNIFICIVAVCMFVSVTAFAAESSTRKTVNLDTGWLYIDNDNAEYATKTADENAFEHVCIPHANVITKHAYQSEKTFQIVSWYRRHIAFPAEYSNKKIFLEFEAVATVAEVYVNGVNVGGHQGAYTPFTLDITDNVSFGADNVIAVKVDARAQKNVPPEGSTIDFMVYGGIVRHVRMIVTEPLHIEWVFVSTENPSQSAPSSPEVNVLARVTNSSSSNTTCSVLTTVFDNENTVVAMAEKAQDVPAGESHEFSMATSALSNAHLWHIDDPYLYTVKTSVLAGAVAVDEYVTRMGIRSLTMNKNDGKCYLNGEAIKLRGLNRHETYPYIGRAASKRLQRQDADILKYELGCNIVRTSHYPQAPDFFDRCDEIGLLVLEEIPGWMYIGNVQWCELQKQVLKDMIIRDRNHPSILTFGVRINESADNNSFYQEMNDIAHELDPTRLTCGVRRGNSDPATSFLEDIWTQNFVVPSSSAPNMPVITTEFCGHNLNPQAHSWDTDKIQISQITNGSYGHAMGHDRSYRQSNWGGLLGWCAFDYASPHGNATTKEDGRYVSPHGVADIFRLPKLAAWFYQSQRNPELYGAMVHICNFWKSGSPADVLVVSNCEEVELFQDGKSLGKKDGGNLYTSLPHPLYSWNVSFSPGELKAVGYSNGEEAATHVVNTPGAPSDVTIAADTTTLYTGGDMTRVVVSIVDEYGQVLRDRDDAVTLSATGAGTFIGEESVKLEGGQMAFYVKTYAHETGTIICNAEAGGFSGSTEIIVKKEEPVSARPRVMAGGKRNAAVDRQFRYVCFDENIRNALPVSTGDHIQIFDISGKLLHSTIVGSEHRGLHHRKDVSGIRIVRIDRVVK